MTISSNLGRWRAEIPPNTSIDRLVEVCVPAGGKAEVTVATPAVSAVYRDPTKAALSGHVDRPVGILIRIDRPRGRARTGWMRCPT